MNNNYALLFLYFDTFFNFPKGRSPVTFFEHVGIIVSHSRASRQDTFFDLLLSVNIGLTWGHFSDGDNEVLCIVREQCCRLPGTLPLVVQSSVMY